MSSELDAAEDFPFNVPKTPPTNPDLPPSERNRGKKPFSGGYYWFPTPTPNGITWSIFNCRDLGCHSDAGHDAELWPRLMFPLATAWSKDAQILKKNLALYYTALPRGRVTRPDKTFLVLHGKDSPIEMWEQLIITSFCLSGRKVKFVFDEHETQIRSHPERLHSLIGSSISTVS